MKVPYNELDMMTALASMDDTILQKSEVQDSLQQWFSLSQAELNVQAASFHGIQVLDLINSPNYDSLLKAYREQRVLDLVHHLETLGYSNKESWAVICVLFGAIAI